MNVIIKLAIGFVDTIIINLIRVNIPIIKGVEKYDDGERYHVGICKEIR
ncbi:hypothetical protein SAMN05518872_109200 [Psychrobacillus sp. OK032]|nr:hypothetical protein SAMN05518872_109200 [Psychrobacillus sp. OK032]